MPILFDIMQFSLPLAPVTQQVDVAPGRARIAGKVCLVHTRKV